MMNTFDINNINQSMIKTQYAVRGRLPIEATKISEEIEKSKLNNQPNPYPFNKIAFCNIGNPQQFNQKPLTYIRQVLSMIENPEIINNENLNYHKDLKERAKKYNNAMGCIGATGAYSNSKGHTLFRKEVANFLKERDGIESNPEHIFITDGASSGIKMCLQMVITNEKDGIMIPIPQYPLYSATITLCGGKQVNYYLDEDNNWELNMKEFEESYNNAIKNGINVKAVVVINPGNPTGAVLKEENIKQIIKFAYEHKIAIFADEVYQSNIYGDIPFISFRKVLHSLPEYKNDVQLISFHSVSKGFYGECGKRGGFMELQNIPEDIVSIFYKLSSINLCSNVVGQTVVSLVVNPPKEGDESYNEYIKEREELLGSLKRKAIKLHDALSKLEGYSLCPVMGSMYLFPQIRLPERFIEEMNKINEKPDEMYCLDMLRHTGICVVPGSGFGQKENTYHYRIAFLPPEDQIGDVVNIIKTFHEDFMKKWK